MPGKGLRAADGEAAPAWVLACGTDGPGNEARALPPPFRIRLRRRHIPASPHHSWKFRVPEETPNGFLSELRRRKVFQALGVYAVAGWAVIQVAATTFPLLGLPDWAPKLVLALVLLGLPFAILLAWVYDLTAGGLKRTSARAADGDAARARHGALARLGAAVLIALIGFGAYAWYARADGGGAGERIQSIAVLPFADMSPGKDQEYLGDGITEELLNGLAQVEGMQVAARTSSFSFKNKDVPVPEIGRQLNVQAVLEGSVRRDGNEIRITAQLINVETGYHLWSATYDRELSSIFAIQDEISRAIVEALKVELSGEAAAKLARRATADPEAQDLYLRGLFHANRRRAADLRRAIDYFEQAIARDANYADAHAGVALGWILLPAYDTLRVADAAARARPAIERALRLNPELADAHAIHGLIAFQTLDLRTAEASYRRSLELNPRAVQTLVWYSQLLGALGRFDESIARALEAERIDKLSALASNNVGYMRLFRREYGQAAEQFRRALELDPGYSSPLNNLLVAYRRAGDWPAYWAEVERQRGEGVLRAGEEALAISRAIAGTGDRAAALAALRQPEWRNHKNCYTTAGSLAQLGERADALDVLERCRDHQHYNMRYTAVNPDFDSLRDEPRYRALVRDLGLEDAARRSEALRR